MNINWIAESLDTIISLSGKYGRWLNIKRKKQCFYIWAVCAAYWMIRDFDLGLYSQAFFCGTSVILNLYGVYSWGEADKKLN